MATSRAEVRLAELVATLSLGTDLGLGQPMEHIIRQTRIALRMGDLLGLDDAERVVVYYSGLLAWVCCYVDAYEQSRWFGDDLKLKGDGFTAESEARFFLTHLGSGRPLLARARIGLAFPGDGVKWLKGMLTNHWIAADALATRLGLGEDVRACMRQNFERWDGKHTMLGLQGNEILLEARLIHLADVVEIFYRMGGSEAAVEVARRRSGKQFDPGLVDAFADNAAELLDGLDETSNWDAIISAEPSLSTWLTKDEFNAVIGAMGDFTDLKSPYTIGHSRSVAELANGAAIRYGLAEADAATIRQAAMLHDIGRLGVPNSIWDKKGPLTDSEMERVRLHPYYTERMLAFSPALASLSAIAAQNHERLDGSGYPRGLSGEAITPAGRILAAADVYHALIELRPYRPARTAEDAAAILRSEVTAGRLEGDAVNAVLHTAGHKVRGHREWPGGLTSREVEVLRLVARGLSNKEIAGVLFISPKTAGNHIEHIYTRIGVSSRATASVYAMQHGLLADGYEV